MKNHIKYIIYHKIYKPSANPKPHQCTYYLSTLSEYYENNKHINDKKKKH